MTEKKMFGGLSFLVGGNMAVAASGQGGLLVRVDPAERTSSSIHARDADGDGRPVDGRVAAGRFGDVETDEALAEWVDRGVSYARSLPPK